MMTIILPLIATAAIVGWNTANNTGQIVLRDIIGWNVVLAALWFSWAAVWKLSGQTPYGFSADGLYGQARMFLWFAAATGLVWLSDWTVKRFQAPTKDEAP